LIFSPNWKDVFLEAVATELEKQEELKKVVLPVELVPVLADPDSRKQVETC
jgi:transcriptional regulator of met regulon